jgi:hypothetical protein
MSHGYIYIMTNPALHDMVKIGYATDVEARRKQLSTTALPYDYEVYATYETPGNLEDKKLHALIDKLNPDLRVSKSREFFLMTPEDAYDLLETIATISGTTERLKRKKIQAGRQKIRKPPIDFKKCGIPIGAELVYTDDPAIKVIVVDNRKVQFGDEITSLSAVVEQLKNRSAVQGPLWFTYQGRPLIDIANETQWKNFQG